MEADIYEASAKASATSKLDDCKVHPEVILHPRHTIGGLQYSDHKNGQKDCTIFFQPEAGKPLVAGKIRQIFSLPKNSSVGSDERVVVIAVQWYKQVMHDIPNPSKRFEGFGAELWSRNLGEVEIIRPIMTYL